MSVTPPHTWFPVALGHLGSLPVRCPHDIPAVERFYGIDHSEDSPHFSCNTVPPHMIGVWKDHETTHHLSFYNGLPDITSWWKRPIDTQHNDMSMSRAYLDAWYHQDPAIRTAGQPVTLHCVVVGDGDGIKTGLLCTLQDLIDTALTVP